MSFSNHKFLVMDDDPTFLEQMPDILSGYGEIDCFSTIDQGIAAIAAKFYDVAILDLNFDNDKRTGLDLFQRILSLDRGIDVLMITGETDPRRIFDLVNSGVRRFLPKPANVMEIRSQVDAIIEERELRHRSLVLSSESAENAPTLIGGSPQMLKIRDQIERIVQHGIKDVLIQGETGTGKEVLARHIAALADRSRRFYAVNCASLTEGLIQSELFGHMKGAFTGADREKKGIFEAAQGGYVFLDEIGDMPLSQQPKLLRALQERTVQRVGDVAERAANFRTISASHVGLKDAVEKGAFREDLFFRISKEIIVIPPLRERPGDIKELVMYFLAKTKKNCSITEDALALLQSYSWPGNIRQLEAAVESLVIRCKDVIRNSHVLSVIPDLAAMSSSEIKKAIVGAYGLQLINSERQRFQKAILEANGDRNQAAKILGLPRSSFFRKAKELGLVRSRRQRSMLFGGLGIK